MTLLKLKLISDITKTANAGDDTFHKTRIFASYSLDTQVTKEACKLFACHNGNKRYLQAIRLTFMMTKEGCKLFA
jgi:predicted transcriptional regulator